MKKKALLFVFLIFFIPNIFGVENISICKTISIPGDYVLNQSLTFSTSGQPCLRITVDNVNLDCQGYTITGTKAVNQNGIFIDSSNNNHIKNCNLSKFYNNFIVSGSGNILENVTSFDSGTSGGIGVSGTNNKVINSKSINNPATGLSIQGTGHTVINFTSSGNSNGIIIQTSHNNNLTNVIISGNSNYGMGLMYGSNSNSFYNVTSLSNKRGFDVEGTGNIFKNFISKSNSEYDLYFITAGNNLYDYNFTSKKTYSNSNQNLYGTQVDGRVFSCGKYEWYGSNYRLMNNLSFSASSQSCLKFSVDNINLDCQGFTLTGTKAVNQNGIFLDNSHNHHIKNCNIKSFNIDFTIGNSNNNVIENVVVSDSGNTAFSVSGLNNQIINSKSINNPGQTGLSLFTNGQNTVINFTAYGNSYGLFLQNTINNNIINSKFYSNSINNVYFMSSTGNTLYGNYLDRTVKINGGAGNTFTSSGTQIGNYYGSDITCSANETRDFNGYTYSVCTNPASHTFNTVTDSAPLATPNLVSIPLIATFVSPTLNDNVNIKDKNWTVINVSSNQGLTGCDLVWKGASESMIVSGTYCYINKTDIANGTYNYRVDIVDGVKSASTETRSIIFGDIPVVEKSIFPASSFLSQIISLIMVVGFVVFG